jgi:hypothetical protein
MAGLRAVGGGEGGTAAGLVGASTPRDDSRARLVDDRAAAAVDAGSEGVYSIRKQATIYDRPNVNGIVLDKRDPGTGETIRGVEEEHDYEAWLKVSVEGQEGWTRLRDDQGNHVVMRESDDFDEVDVDEQLQIQRTASQWQRATGAAQDWDDDMVSSPGTREVQAINRRVVRRPLTSARVRMESMTNSLSEHSLADSTEVCVGARQKQIRVPRGARCIPINPVFLEHIEFAARGGIGALLAALPAFLNAEWARYPFSTFDLTFGAVAFTFVFSHSFGETSKFIFQSMAGAITAAIVPQLAINTFGHEMVPVLLFMGFYSWAVLSLPVEPFAKKFSLGLCVHYLMIYHALPPEGNIQKKTTYQVVLLGLYGCFVALFMNIYPYPRFAITNAFTGIRRCITDIQFCTRNLVEGYLDGENLQDRARTLKYFDHLTVELRSLDQSLLDAWWEPWAQGRVHKYRAVALLIHKLRTDLFGMQKALMERKRDQTHKDLMAKKTFLMRDGKFEEVMKFEETLRDLMLCSLSTLRAVVLYVAGDQEKEWSGNVTRQSKDKMRTKIQEDIAQMKVLENALKRFHHDYSQLRRELSSKTDDERLEHNKWLNVFLFNLTSYCQALMDFPENYAHGLEQAQSDKHIFLPESKMVVLSFQKRQLISAAKTSSAIVAAAFINMKFNFTNQALAPVLIAYIMGGNVAGSWAATADRVVGLISGMIFAFFFTIFSECDKYALGTGFAFVVMIAFYVRVSSRQHSYAGLVAAFVECLVMVSPCQSDTRLQLDMVEQIVISCLLVSFAEVFILPSSSSLFFRKQVADTLLDCLGVFKEVFDAHISTNLESLTTRPPKSVDDALWKNLPGSLHKMENYLAQSMMEPALWAPEMPHSAYQKLIYAVRRMNLHLILLHRALVQLHQMRKSKEHGEVIREQKLLLDELVRDGPTLPPCWLPSTFACARAGLTASRLMCTWAWASLRARVDRSSTKRT